LVPELWTGKHFGRARLEVDKEQQNAQLSRIPPAAGLGDFERALLAPILANSSLAGPNPCKSTAMALNHSNLPKPLGIFQTDKYILQVYPITSTFSWESHGRPRASHWAQPIGRWACPIPRAPMESMGTHGFHGFHVVSSIF
jgi:hypothetical protein